MPLFSHLPITGNGQNLPRHHLFGGVKTVLVSIYSGRSCWVMVPAKHRPPLASVTECGTLIFESTIPSILVSDEMWRRFRTDINRQGFSQVSEDVGLRLMDECMERYGTITVLCEDAPGRIF